MSKRHYQAIADMVRYTPMPDESRAELVDRMIVFFAEDNERFDDVRFLEAAEGRNT